MPKTCKKPAYTHHKATNQARVRIGGKDHYIGEYGSPESRDRYDDLVAAWFAGNGDTAKHTLAIDDLSLQFIAHADTYYRRKDGSPTGETTSLRHAISFLLRLHGRTNARQFGPIKLKEVRELMITAGMCRTNINRQIHRIKRMFAWAVENELVPVTVYQALQSMRGLYAGRSKARESAPVRPVEAGTVKDTIPHLSPVVADMVRLQLLCGARPGEVCGMRPCDVTRGTNGTWTLHPATHKTQHHGRERRIFIGPEGQEILAPYLDRDPEAYCFSPIEAEAERNATRALIEDHR